ncbi:MAG: type II and III secretion system protein family protein [Proteobacteria bacterium]|nr:type II and III secretion system protein family protein [Pseudomonadota bacterium]
MRIRGLAVWVLALLMTWPATGRAAGRAISLEAGGGQVVALSAPVTNVFVANPKVADARPASPTSLFIFGVGPGQTVVAALDATGKPVAIVHVSVSASGFAARQAMAALARLLPGGQVHIAQEANGLLLTGTVATPADAARAVAVARGFAAAGDAIDNQIVVRASTQVTLQVRIVQMSRTISDQLGINWSALGTIGSIGAIGAGVAATGGGAVALATNGLIPAKALSNAGNYSLRSVNISGALDALAQDGLVRILAEPNLTVMSGKKASFLVGGEFPVPIPAGTTGGVSITYKNFGVSLNFRPTVFSDGRISIHVAPEVSEISSANAVTISAGPGSNATFVVPSLTVSRAETTVQLGSGQSFAIGGLLQDTINDGANGVPNISNIPILGALFRNDTFNRQQTELVIIVTPIIVRPVDDPAALHVPAENFKAPSDLDRLLRMRQIETKDPSAPRHIPGDAGFIVQ